MLSLKSEKPRYTPRQDADRELPILVNPIIYKNMAEKQQLFLVMSNQWTRRIRSSMRHSELNSQLNTL